MKVIKHRSWSVSESGSAYREVDWRSLSGAQIPQNVRFIRVAGKAEPEEAAEAARAISRLRQTHDAYVITNAVSVTRADSPEISAESLEQMQQLDVFEMLMEYLTPEQQAVVRSIKTKEEAND